MMRAALGQPTLGLIPHGLPLVDVDDIGDRTGSDDNDEEP
jgi:hypothetical protein